MLQQMLGNKLRKLAAEKGLQIEAHYLQETYNNLVKILEEAAEYGETQTSVMTFSGKKHWWHNIPSKKNPPIVEMKWQVAQKFLTKLKELGVKGCIKIRKSKTTRDSLHIFDVIASWEK